MAEKTTTSFSVNVGTCHQLPVDMSLNSFCKSLASDYAGTPPSRKLIRGAFSSLAFDGKESDCSTDTLYDRLLKCTYSDGRNENAHNTYPHAIFWETQDLLRAVCKARRTSRTLRDEPLAEKTLDILLERLKNLPPQDLASQYTDYQLLREEYIRFKLVENLSPEIIKRLDTIFRLTVHQTDKTALKTMPIAFEHLDALIVELLRQKGISRTRPDLPPSIDVFCSYYNRLVDERPRIMNQDQIHEAFTFELQGNPHLMKELKDTFDPPQKPKEQGSKTQKPDAEKMTALFEQYLQKRAEITDSKSKPLIKKFVKSYSELKTYVETQDTWEAIEASLREELHAYLKALFDDITKGDYIPYDYSTHQSSSAASAYMNPLCKNAHNRIGAELHLPLRLLQQQTYYAHLLQCLNHNTIREQATTPLSKWTTLASNVRKELAKKYPSVPRLEQADDISPFIDMYNNKVSSITDVSLNKRTVKQMLQVASASDTTPLKRFYAVADLLRLECHMIAYALTETAISEMKAIHRKLQEFYKQCSASQKSAETP